MKKISLLLLMLVGCGGSSPGNTVAPTIKPLPVISFYGESTYLGYPFLIDYSVSVIVNKTLNVPTKSEAVVSTVEQLVLGTDGMHQSWTIESGTTSQNIVVNFGINEVYQKVDIETTKASYVTLITVAQSKGKLIILQTPNYTTVYNMDAEVAMIRDVSAAYAVPLIDTYEYSKSLPLYDGVHPTPDSYLKLGAVTSQRLKEILNL